MTVTGVWSWEVMPVALDCCNWLMRIPNYCMPSTFVTKLDCSVKKHKLMIITTILTKLGHGKGYQVTGILYCFSNT